MLANEKRLHLVELREENDNFPKLVASPDNGPVRTKEEIGYNEILVRHIECKIEQQSLIDFLISFSGF